jgi:ketosteroid isomerase-like protein
MRIARLAVLAAVPFLVPGQAESQSIDDLAAQVRADETAFASTMAERDLSAFLSYVSEEAIFFTGRELRGIEAIKKGWAPFFEADSAPFSWEPADVVVLDSGELALSSGPVLGPDGNRIGTFNSVWRLEADGRWRVVFDKGCPPCDCPG